MSISQRKSNGRFLVKYKEPSGIWKQKSFRTREDAEAFEREMEYEKSENKRLTVTESVLFFLKNVNLCERRKKEYLRILSRMDDSFGDIYAEELNRRDLEAFRDAMKGAGLRTRVINSTVSRLKTVWRFCASEDVMTCVPWERYRPLHDPEPTGSWHGDENAWHKIYGAAPDWLQWSLRTCLALCLRPGVEVCGLRWEDVDLDEGKAGVWMPKVSARKIVFIPDWWIAEATQKKIVSKCIFVCPNSRGQRASYVAMSGSWRRTQKRIGLLGGCPMYTVRHMAASTMISQGADAAAVAAQLGHKNVTTTGTFYIHATQSSQRMASKLVCAPDLVSFGVNELEYKAEIIDESK